MSNYRFAQAIHDIRLIFGAYWSSFEAALTTGFNAGMSGTLQTLRPEADQLPEIDEDIAVENMIRAYRAGVFFPQVQYVRLRREARNPKTKMLCAAFEMLGSIYSKTLRETYSEHPLTKEAILGKNVVISIDTSVGYIALLASVFAEILEKSASLKVMVHDRRFLLLLQRSYPKISFEMAPPKIEQMQAVFSEDNTVGLQTFSALFVMRRLFRDFPLNQKPCLVPDALKTKSFKSRIDALGKGLKIGLSWRTKTPLRQRQRTLPLTEWENILTLTDVFFCNLQYGSCVRDLQEVKETFGVNVHDFPDADPLKDLDSFVANIVAALDIVISTDNSTVYFACALGKPTLMLTHTDGLDLWGGWDDTPWWDSLRIIRQDNPDDWEPVIARAAEEVRHFQRTGTFTPLDPERSFKKTFKLLEGIISF